MSLWNWFSGQIESITIRPTRIFVPKSNDLIADASGAVGTTSGVKLVAEEHYLRLWLREMCLRDDRVWFTTRYPAVHSVVGLQYGDRTLELANISGNSKLQLKAVDLDRSVQTNYPLTALLPFRGGTVQLDCGLVSMKNDDLVKEFTGVVSDFAGKLTVPQVSSAISLASSVASGIQEVLTGGAAAAKLYYHTAFTGQNAATELVSGFIFLSAVPENTISRDQLWITSNGVRKGVNKDSLTSLDVSDYMVVQIECVVARDDWQQLTSIADPFQVAVDAKIGGDTDKAKVLFNQARMAAFKSTDLTSLDRKRVLAAMVMHFNELGAEGAPESAGLRPPALKSAVGKISVADARVMSLPTEREILAS
jgi:hypothetical protein